MPKRPRSHQLEARSRILFQDVLPDEWIVRPENPDYGVDCQVEVVDADGTVTGRRFYVQLKGTDTPGARGPTVRIKRDTGSYLMSLDDPALIVLCDVSTSRLWTAWFHRFDPYYGGLGEKWITFRFNDTDLWTGDRARLIDRDLQGIRRIRGGKAPFPIPIWVDVTTDNVGRFSKNQILSSLEDSLRPVGDLAAISPSESASLVDIQIDSSEVRITVGAKSGFILHNPGNSLSSDVLAADIVLSLGIALDRFGYSSQASRLIRHAAERSNLVRHPEIVGRMIAAFTRAEDIFSSLALVTLLSGQADAELNYVAQLFHAPALVLRSRLSQEREAYYRSHLEGQVSAAERADDGVASAVAHYNLGRHIIASEPRRSLRHYIRAARLDQGYWERDYFAREIAGLFFEIGRYICAQRSYQLAIDNGLGEDVRPQQADCLLFSGRYAEAQALFESHLDDCEGQPCAEWVLKADLCAYLRDRFGFDSQFRDQGTALREVSAVSSQLAEPDRQKLLRALEADALCGLAWFNLGALQSQREEREASLLSFVCCATVQRWDVEAWVNALLLSMTSSENRHLMPWILLAALEATGSRFMEQVAAQVDQQQVEEAKKAQLMELIREAAKVTSHRSGEHPKLVFRQVLPDGKYHMIELQYPMRRR